MTVYISSVNFTISVEEKVMTILDTNTGQRIVIDNPWQALELIEYAERLLIHMDAEAAGLPSARIYNMDGKR